MKLRNFGRFEAECGKCAARGVLHQAAAVKMKLISADQTGASGFHAPMEFEFRFLAAVFLPIKIGSETKAATNPLLECVPLLLITIRISFRWILHFRVANSANDWKIFIF